MATHIRATSYPFWKQSQAHGPWRKRPTERGGPWQTARVHSLTADLIDAADAAGRQRLADNHRRVAANLDKIITALEGLPRAGAGDD